VYGFENGKMVFSGALPIHMFRHFCCTIYHLATADYVTDTQMTVYHANSWSAVRSAEN